MDAAEKRILRDHVLAALNAEGAHTDLEQALDGLPAHLHGAKLPGAPHTPWRLLEHVRIAQCDILEFCRNPDHVSPDFPAGYWPDADAPPAANAWAASLADFRSDQDAMKRLVMEADDLLSPLPHGDGQTLLREALLVADHNAYHLGQLVLMRRLLEAAGTT